MSTTQSRVSRPNPRWPQADEVQQLVANVRAAIAADPAGLGAHCSPVTTLAEPIVASWCMEDAGLASDYHGLLAKVVEGVLADAAARFMLAEQGLHVCPLGPRRKGGAR